MYMYNNSFHCSIFRFPSWLKPPEIHGFYDFKRPYCIIIGHKLVNNFVKFRRRVLLLIKM